mmetsp:Transcript_21505/g.51767  ORF Transcript_21505/g.51767 Transcript_21505/m.51767 type:complete len:219 (-) Transcript_21505:103-759(-)
MDLTRKLTASTFRGMASPAAASGMPDRTVSASPLTGKAGMEMPLAETEMGGESWYTTGLVTLNDRTVGTEAGTVVRTCIAICLVMLLKLPCILTSPATPSAPEGADAPDSPERVMKLPDSIEGEVARMGTDGSRVRVNVFTAAGYGVNWPIRADTMPAWITCSGCSVTSASAATSGQAGYAPPVHPGSKFVVATPSVAIRTRGDACPAVGFVTLKEKA